MYIIMWEIFNGHKIFGRSTLKFLASAMKLSSCVIKPRHNLLYNWHSAKWIKYVKASVSQWVNDGFLFISPYEILMAVPVGGNSIPVILRVLTKSRAAPIPPPYLQGVSPFTLQRYLLVGNWNRDEVTNEQNNLLDLIFRRVLAQRGKRRLTVSHFPPP